MGDEGCHLNCRLDDGEVTLPMIVCRKLMLHRAGRKV